MNIRDVTFALLNADVYSEIKKRTIIKGAEYQKEPIASICKSILEQRNLFPVWPTSIPID